MKLLKTNTRPTMILRMTTAVLLAALTFTGCRLFTAQEPVTQVNLRIQGTRPGTLAGTAVRSTARTSGRLRAVGDPVVLPVIGVSGSTIGEITLIDARLVLKEIEFEQESSDGATETEIEYEYEGPYLVDLLADEVVPPLDTIELPEGMYSEIKFKLHKVEGGEEDETGTSLLDPADPLFGNSIYLEGSYTGLTAGGESTAVPFSMTFNIDEEFKLKADGEQVNGFLIEHGTVNSIIIAFRLGRWFSFDDPETNSDAVDLSALVVTGEGLVLDETGIGDASLVREVIRKNIERSADYGKDEDEDGKLESDEDDDPEEEDEDDDGRS